MLRQIPKGRICYFRTTAEVYSLKISTLFGKTEDRRVRNGEALQVNRAQLKKMNQSVRWKFRRFWITRCRKESSQFEIMTAPIFMSFDSYPCARFLREYPNTVVADRVTGHIYLREGCKEGNIVII